MRRYRRAVAERRVCARKLFDAANGVIRERKANVMQGSIGAGMPGMCYRCGTTDQVSICHGDGGYVYLCPECPHPAE